MSGTDHRKELLTGGPAIILVEPQLGENIGMVARAMANFGLSDLRLVNPRDGWPSDKARSAASRADHVIDAVRVFPDLASAIADLNRVFATTARQRDMNKPVLGPDAAADAAARHMAEGEGVGILFGRERWGLENDEIAVSDCIVTYPVNPAFASLNIAQAVLLMAYEWRKTSTDSGGTAFDALETVPASRQDLHSLFEHLEGSLEAAHYFFPEEKRDRMVTGLRNLLTNAKFTESEIRTLRGVIAALERRWMKDRKDG